MPEITDVKKYFLKMAGIFIILTAATAATASAGIGTNDDNVPLTNPELLLGSIVPQVSETGKISLSTDGLGTNNANGGKIQVDKPAGATVRKAFLAAATTGFWNHKLVAGDIRIDGADVFPWDIETPSSISSYNYWKDVTSMVKSKIDAAPAGLIDFDITEVNTGGIDGEILAVIFDDPGQTTDNTIVLLFGAQNVLGDTFNIGLANPIDKTDPNLVLDMALGISFGYQEFGGGQVSLVDVNSVRLTSSAGGEDDGEHANGGLLTVGGLGDSNANPLPNAPPTNERTDDELYSLLPFVNNGDTSIKVDTINPSNDDNIFFASLNLRAVTAVVGQGIVLSPPTATNTVGTTHTVTAKVQDANGNPIVSRDVTFTVISGPNAGTTGIVATDATGKAEFTYLSNGNTGTDMIQASFMDDAGKTVYSNKVEKVWERSTSVPEFPAVALPVISILGMIFVISRRKN